MTNELQTRVQFLAYLRGADGALAHAGAETPSQRSAIATLAGEVESAELIVPIVGGFSAGKSTAINAFLGEDALAVNITPETALATELRHTSEAGYAEGIRTDEAGNVRTTTRLTLDEFAHVKERAAEFSHVRAHLPNSNLARIEPLVLVDMPGFDAPIRAHNDAINAYLQRGAHFIVLQSADSGTLQLTIKNHIHNLLAMGRKFSFALTKCDLPAPADVERIAESIGDDLAASFGYDGEVARIYNGDGLGAVLEGIDPEAIFSHVYLARLQDSYRDTRHALKTRIDSLRADKDAADAAIAELNASVAQLESARTEMGSQTGSRAQSAATATINAVVAALASNQSQLATAAQGGESALSKSVSDLVRSTLISEFGTRSKDERERLMNAYRGELAGLSIGGFDLGSQWVDDVTSGVARMLEDVAFGRGGALDGIIKGTIAGATPSLLATIGGFLTKLPIVGGLVAPIISALGGFLPAIVGGLVSAIFGFKRKPQIDGGAIVAKLIPVIQSQLQGSVLGEYNANFNSAKEVAGRCLEAKVSEKAAQIAAAQDEKRSHATQIETQIAALQSAISELDELAGKYLSTTLR